MDHRLARSRLSPHGRIRGCLPRSDASAVRYGAARSSRNEYDPTTDEHGWTRIRESLLSSVLIRDHLWLQKSSRAAKISSGTDRATVWFRLCRSCALVFSAALELSDLGGPLR